MLIFAVSGMRRWRSSVSWYFCICRYCKFHPSFQTGYDAALVHPVFLLVLCPDCSFVHSHMPFPECRFFSTALAQQAALHPVTPYPLYPSGDGSCCIFFPSFPLVKLLLPHYAQSLPILKAAWGWSSAELLRVAWYWINIAYWALCHHSYLDLLF